MARPKKNQQAGEAFKKLLTEKKLSQYKLAQLTGLGKDHISRIASGEIASPEPTTIAKIAKALEIELGEITKIFVQSSNSLDAEKKLISHSEALLQPQQLEQDKTLSKNADFLGREGAIATSEDIGTPQLPRFRLEPLTERVRAWQLEEDSLDQELYALERTTYDDPDFIGREKALNDLDNLINNEDAKVVLIQAEGGVGKTALAWNWFERQGLTRKDSRLLELDVGKTPQIIHSAEDWVRDTLRNHFKEQNPERNFLTMLEQLKSNLQTKRIGVLIDNLESALINGEFIEPHGSYYVELLRVLAHPSVQSITLITSREPLYEPGVMSFQTIQTYRLEVLAKEVWEQYFENRNISIDVDGLSEMHRIYGGNALAMDILSRDIRKESLGNLKTYWQHNRDNLISSNQILEILIKRQFKKLSNDNFQAYKLLCRLGFYLAQDVSFIPKAWLFCLLWDVPQNQRRRVIDALLDRSLLKVRKVPEDEYYLHPVIWVEALDRLKSIEQASTETLLLIKEQIEAILASDRELQNFLAQVNEKSSLVQVPCHPLNLRAFYFSLFYDLTTTRHIAGELGAACEFEGVDENVFDYDLIYERLYDLYLDLTLVSTLSCDSYSEFCQNLGWCRVDSIRDPKLLLSLQQLQSQLPELEEQWEIFDDEEWWLANGQEWIETLREIVINYRNLPLNWELNDMQIELLDQYYDMNKLLVDCLNSTSNLSPEVRWHIESTLFLPIAEIEQHNRLR